MNYSTRPSVYIQGLKPVEDTGGSILRVAVVFGLLAVGGAVIAVPLLQLAVGQFAGSDFIDRTFTGSTRGETVRYTVRKSVLTAMPEKICKYRSTQLCD